MKDHLVFLLSAYLLSALFYTIYIFTAGTMAALIALFFGVNMLVQLIYLNKQYLKETLRQLKYRFTEFFRDLSTH